MRLWLYLTLVVNSIILLAFLGYGSYTASEQAASLAQNLENETRNMARNLAAGSANDLLMSHFDEIEGGMLRQVMLGAVQELVVADSHARILVQVQRDANGEARPVYEHISALLDVSQAEVRTPANYTLLLPIERGERLGWVRVTTSLSALDSTQRRTWTNTLLVSLLTVLVTGALLAVFLRKATAALGRATEFANDLIQQRGSTMPTISQIVEIEQLRKALNSAAQALATQFLALQDSEAKQKHIAALLRQNAKDMTDREFALNQHAIVSMTDPDGNITYANGLFCQISGYPLTELLGQNHRLIQSGLHPPVFFADLWKTIAAGRVWHGEICNRDRSGALYWVNASIVPLLSEDGRPEQYIAIRTDISARKEAERALLLAKEVAEQANKVKSDFLANMSHEIRTPMNGIIGMTELALDTELNTEQREYLDLVKVSAHALLNIVNDILDFSKIEAGRLDIETIEFSLEQMLRDTLKSLAVRAHQKNLELLLHIAPDVPDRLMGDPGRLRQVLVNLIGNAIKFTPSGEVEVAVHRIGPTALTQTPTPAATATDLRFSVRDTGIGIARDKFKAVFDSFSQADTSTTRQYGGTGLGLTISAQLVALMGGCIELDSKLGQGSTFHFTLNLPSVSRDAFSHYQSSGRVTGLPVLIADDNATNRSLLVQMLRNWNMQPTAVASGAQALTELERAAASGQPYALALLDVQMPEMDGFELVQHIRQHPQYVAATVMMLTSEGQRGHAARCRELGIASYLMKPISQSELLDAIMTALGEPGQPRTALITRHSLREARRKLHLLLAEDNAVNQTLAVRLLQKLGHTVTVAHNGAEALQHWQTSPGEFDAILMDVDMPVMNGYETTQRIRALEQERGVPDATRIPIVAMTAHAMQGARETCLRHGMDAYLAKPIDTEALWCELDGLMQGKEAAPVPQTPAPQSAPVADFAATRQTMDDDRDLFEEIVRLFQSDAPQQLQQLRQGLEQGNSTEVHHRAHTLKGMASLFGAQRTVQAAARLEQLAAQGDLARVEVQTTADELEAAMVELHVALQDYQW